MATSRKKKSAEEKVITEEKQEVMTEEVAVIGEPETTERVVKEKSIKAPKFAIGSIVFIAKDADADLEGFKLFPQYKKYTYTVEAYDGNTGIYSLRRLNLSLKLKERDIVPPHENAHDSINKAQY